MVALALTDATHFALDRAKLAGAVPRLGCLRGER
jgi:hypothetical protein